MKPYFTVNNTYVIKKIKHVLLPFLYKLPENNLDQDLEEDLTISQNRIEFPDLYLPLMSFITYIIILAFNSANTLNEK